ncbi:TetR/AcrR family transcriptional regulator [Corynebacterium guangdongense]|uniref:AcrR family transcriptional regulator n=1 Tax=Corynebacterium guangdongense TaxID=1783348 RepID=A0ABU1ZZU4_9CORY|nr:TetR/AcrR family transcriptional regulator [Corynebacterium guangdongense]MDR7329908.1 AcrR family transcriptional regulator [Corynebacterium guangdongense]WJZ18466.1 Transcriptional regulator, TetR family [Corynebacterium guangdongense]
MTSTPDPSAIPPSTAPGPAPQNDPAAPGLRERKKIETRRRIRHAALDLAMEHGLEQLTVEMIADKVDLSRRTFFNYFATKEDALVTDSAGLGDRIRPLLDARPTGEPVLHSLRVILTENDLFQLTGANRARARARQQLVWEHPLLLARQLAADAQATRELAGVIAERMGLDPVTDLRPMVLASAVSSNFRVAVRHWARNEDTVLSELVAEAFDALRAELEPPPAT